MPPDRAGLDASYVEELARAEERSGADESVLTGEGLLSGRPVALVVSEFRFLAGSIGRAAADRIVVGIERATREGLPLVGMPASGGTRMQEGTPAFVQMVRIAAAVSAHRAAGLPYLVYLRHPTTGGVMATWASLGQVTFAEPGALAGFLGPRVYEALYGEPFPPGVQVAENLHAHGLVDQVVPAAHLAATLERTLRVLRDRPGAVPVPAPPTAVAYSVAAVDAWDAVVRSRRADRPGLRALLRYAATDVVELRGTGEGASDPAIVLGLARFGGRSCVLLGQDREAQRSGHLIGPDGLRTARRAMRLAAELRLPLVSVVDTPGAALSAEAEEGGLAGEIARCLADLMTVPTPTISVLLGEGSGGAALALLPADRVLAAQHGWLSPLPPEGASAIVHRDVDHAADLARSQRVGVASLRDLGVVDVVVPEVPDAAEDPVGFCLRIGTTLAAELTALDGLDPAVLVARRPARYAGRERQFVAG